MRKKVYRHAAVAIVSSERSGEFLFDQYTDTYRVLDWRGCVNLIGGNQSLHDSSPWDIWKREVIEEFCDPIFSQTLGVSDASLEARTAFADNLIMHAKPYKDFLVTIPEIREIQNHQTRIRGPLKTVHTVFETFLDQDIFESIRDHLKVGKRIKNEGGSIILGMDDLINGKIRFASVVGRIMQDYLQHIDIKIFGSEGTGITCFGTPRLSMDEYLSDFEYEEIDPIDEKI